MFSVRCMLAVDPQLKQDINDLLGDHPTQREWVWLDLQDPENGQDGICPHDSAYEVDASGLHVHLK